MMNKSYIAYTESDFSSEVWTDIRGYEGLYQISNLGRVRSYDREVCCGKGATRKIKGKVLSLCKGGRVLNDGSFYLKVTLTKDKHSKNASIHRLVAEHFVPNNSPEKFTEVNHIDQNKYNNRASNLEWCDRAYNNHYSLITETLNESKKKPVLQYSYSGEFIARFSGAREAAREVGLRTHKHICECCNGKAKTAGGYVWRWE